MSSQESTSSKRSRVPNFTADEKNLLTRLVNNRKNIIENKYTDAKSVTKKKEAWLLIAREFNSEPNVHKRDHIILKRAWDNLRALTRKARASERGSLIKTGVGPPVPPPPSQQQAILNIMEEAAPSLICDVYNDFDCDGVVLDSSCSLSSERDVLPTVQNAEVTNIVCEPSNPVDEFNIESENKYDETIANPLPHARSANDYIRSEAALRLQTLEVKRKYELQILRTKLKTAQLEQEVAENKLKAAQLEVAFQKNRLKDQL